MEWLFSHPEDPSASAAPAPAAAEPAKDVAQQLKLAPAQVCQCPNTLRHPASVMLAGHWHTLHSVTRLTRGAFPEGSSAALHASHRASSTRAAPSALNMLGLIFRIEKGKEGETKSPKKPLGYLPIYLRNFVY